MHLSLLQIVEKTTLHVKDYVEGIDSKVILKELIQILFDQFKEVGEAHQTFLKFVEKGSRAHKIEIDSYDNHFFWSQVQNVVSEKCSLQNIENSLFLHLT